MSRRTPLGKVLGLGSAKDGTEHWWMQRVTAIALMPLGLWFVFSVAGMAGAGTLDYMGVHTWLSSPFSAVLAILFTVALAYHSSLGLQVVVEDYVHEDWLKVASLIGLKLLHVLLAVMGVFAVFRISFGGPLA